MDDCPQGAPDARANALTDDDRKRVAKCEHGECPLGCVACARQRAPRYPWTPEAGDLMTVVLALDAAEAERDAARADLDSAEHDLARLIATVQAVEDGAACTGDVLNAANRIEANGRPGWLARALRDRNAK